MYSFDTNIFVDWWERRYPPDLFPSVRDRMTDLASAGRVLAVELVRDELKAVTADAGLLNWTKQYAAIFIPTDAAIQTEGASVQQAFPGLLDPKAAYVEADPFVIALAKLRGLTVVTNETPASAKHKPKRSHYIPDVCAALQVPCMDLFAMMRKEAWSF
jgi:hypothetical protein